MKLNYPQKANGMFIIKGPDFDDIATVRVGRKYPPSAGKIEPILVGNKKPLP